VVARAELAPAVSRSVAVVYRIGNAINAHLREGFGVLGLDLGLALGPDADHRQRHQVDGEHLIVQHEAEVLRLAELVEVAWHVRVSLLSLGHF
jgi:hypothetical protein